MKDKKIVNLELKNTILIIIVIVIIGIVFLHTKITGNFNVNVTKKVEEESQAITIIARAKNSDNYIDVTSEDNIIVPVPKGYVASPDVEERYANGVTTEGVREHHGGFVIYERLAEDVGKPDEEVQAIIEENMDLAQRTRNQWVWVPIASSEVSNMYYISENLIYGSEYKFSEDGYSKKTNLTYDKEPALSPDNVNHTYLKEHFGAISANEFLQQMREEFYEMLVSVKTYGGFYIGRYELGNVNSKEPVVRKGNSTIKDVKWNKMYKNCKIIDSSNKNVYTGMIWGIQWDETLKWLIDSGEKTYEEVMYSKSWGNYRDDPIDGNSGIRPTGYSEAWKANNIYDLAGNVRDWTMTYSAINPYGRAARGENTNTYGSVGWSGARTSTNLAERGTPSRNSDVEQCFI